VVAVDRLPAETGHVEERAEADLVRALGEQIEPELAITRFSPTSGTTSASVPMAATLMNPGSHISRSARRHSA
jgi:hypothetical protein